MSILGTSLRGSSGDPQYPVPDLSVRVNGAPLPVQAASDLISASVHQDVDAPGMFTLRLMNWDMARGEVSWADSPLFAPGGEVEVLMGYVGSLENVFSGEITGLEPEFLSGAPPTLTVRGHDRRHRLLRGRNTRTFTKMKDSDIVRQVATGAGLAVRIEDSGVRHEYVLQHNQTDLEFLQERARRIGYELAMEGSTLLFRRRGSVIAGSEALSLSLSANLIEL
ncbi:MAG: contractile injection system protein, VgrG/Pvc8 family [Chloroflexota bacterium]|nr:contractile injection system protein, VgrG/Pvc8 family [Chloroflexota bacterium]